MSPRSLTRLLPLAACSLLLAACAGTKSYYMLSPAGPAPSSGGIGIGVGPVRLAEYIDRPNLVLADNDYQLSLAEDHRWAGDLSRSIANVTAANLGRQLHSANVCTYPWQGDDGLRYQITLEIRQLHGTADGHAVIEAAWRAHTLPERRVHAARTFTAREPLSSDGYPALVAAQSRLLERLAADIAKSL